MGMITNLSRASDPNEEMFCNYIELTAAKIELAEPTEPCTSKSWVSWHTDYSSSAKVPFERMKGIKIENNESSKLLGLPQTKSVD